MNIAKRYKFQNVQEAVGFAVELKQKYGYDLFRGQLHSWSPTPSLFRRGKADKEVARKALQHFFHWGSQIFLLQQFHYDEDSMTAIAQHYRLPTAFLDVTTSPEIAAYFALDGKAPSGSSYSVIFCGRSADLKKVKGIRIIRIEVANLWRLEAQKGFFIAFDENSMVDGNDLNFVQILFKREGKVNLKRNDIYVQEKSLLEIELDHYFKRKSAENLQDHLNELLQKGRLDEVRGTRYQSYPGAFIRRKLPPANNSWLQISKAWVIRPRERYESIRSTKKHIQIKIPKATDPVNFSNRLNSQLASTLKTDLKGRESVGVKILGGDFDEHIRTPLERTLEHLWDGLRNLPYQDMEIVHCLASFVTIVKFKIKENLSVEHTFQQLHGASIAVLFGQYGGAPDGGLVSEQSLQAAIDTSYLKYLNIYYQRKCSENPLFTFIFFMEHSCVFNFEKFKRMFCEELLPSSFADGFLEHISEYLDSTFFDSPTYNPLSLSYWTIFDYATFSPFAYERFIDDKLIIFGDMRKEEVFSDVVAAIYESFQEEKPFRLKVAGFEHDRRELWEIPKVQELAKNLLEYGCMSILEASTYLDLENTPRSTQEEEDRKSSFGAFELWCLSHNILQEVFSTKMTSEYLSQNIWPHFVNALIEQNQVAEKIYQKDIKKTKSPKKIEPQSKSFQLFPCS